MREEKINISDKERQRLENNRLFNHGLGFFFAFIIPFFLNFMVHTNNDALRIGPYYNQDDGWRGIRVRYWNNKGFVSIWLTTTPAISFYDFDTGKETKFPNG